MADFKLGRIKFKWRGNWATSTSYLIDDVVKYGGNSYVATQNHTSPNNENLFYTSPGTYTDYWSLQAESLFFKGTYANSTWYKLNDLVTYGQRKYRCTVAGTAGESFIGESLTYNISGSPVERSYRIQPYTGTCPNLDDVIESAKYTSINALPAGEAVSIDGDTRCFKVIDTGGVTDTNNTIDDTYGGGTAGCNACKTAQARTDNCTATFSTGGYNAGSFTATGTFGSSYSSTDSFSIGTNTGTVSPTSATVSELTSGLIIIASAGATLTLSSQSPANCVGNTHTIEVPLSTCNAVSVFFTNDNPATNTAAANKLCGGSGSAKTAYMNGTTLASSSVIYVNSSCSSFLSGPKYFSEDNSNYYIWNGYSLSGPYSIDCP